MDVTIACPCPPKDGGPRHESDTVTLRDTLDFKRALIVRKAVSLIDNDDPQARGAELLATLSEFYVLQGVESWTLQHEVKNDNGKRVTAGIEVTPAAIREYVLGSPDVELIIEAADTLYQAAILLPLVQRAQRFSPTSQTGTSTSRKNGSGPRPRRPSKRSSTSATRTAATATITPLRVGDSSSSPNSKSAG